MCTFGYEVFDDFVASVFVPVQTRFASRISGGKIGDLSKLTDWAITVVKGVYNDGDKPILLMHVSELEHMTEKPPKEVLRFGGRLRTLIKTARS